MGIYNKEKKNSTKKPTKKKRKFFLVFLVAFLVESVFSLFFSIFLDRFLGRERVFFLFFLIAFLVESVFSCFLTCLFSFINSHLWNSLLFQSQNPVDIWRKSEKQLEDVQWKSSGYPFVSPGLEIWELGTNTIFPGFNDFFHHLFFAKKLSHNPSLILPSVCRSVGWSVCHNFKFHFPRSYRGNCLILAF